MKCNKIAPDFPWEQTLAPTATHHLLDVDVYDDWQAKSLHLTTACREHRRKSACARHNWVSEPFSECATAEHAKNHLGWHRTVNSNQQLVNDVQYNTFTSPCFLFRRSKKACHNHGRAHHATTPRAISSGLRPRTTKSNTLMGMGYSSSHDTPHLPRGVLRSSLHSLVCKPTTTETPTLFHPGTWRQHLVLMLLSLPRHTGAQTIVDMELEVLEYVSNNCVSTEKLPLQT